MNGTQILEMSLIDKLLYGLEMLVFGLGTVFAVLILLWGLLVLFKFVFHTLPERAKDNKTVQAYKEAKEKMYTPAPAPVSACAPVAPASAQDEELVAIIAAITAYRRAQNNDRPFRVVSFKKR